MNTKSQEKVRRNGLTVLRYRNSAITIQCTDADTLKVFLNQLQEALIESAKANERLTCHCLAKEDILLLTRISVCKSNIVEL